MKKRVTCHSTSIEEGALYRLSRGPSIYRPNVTLSGPCVSLSGHSITQSLNQGPTYLRPGGQPFLGLAYCSNPVRME